MTAMIGDDIRIAVGLRLPDDVVRARQAGRDAARTLGFGLADQTRMATAISEITRNALHYGGGGVCEIMGHRDGLRREIVVSVTDQGPGIPDIDKAMTPGFSTGNSLGMGLPGARKLVDSLEIESRPGHTRVVMVMRRRLT
jgi:serine/threonine-protein kinase RsbT